VESFVALLNHWQTLIGSLIGALVGLMSALIVASRVERREDLAAGMLLVAVLSPVAAASGQIGELADERGITGDEDRTLFMAEKLARLRPRFPDATESAATRLMPINNVMAAHLTLFVHHYREFEEKILLVGAAYENLRRGDDAADMRDAVLLNSKTAVRNFLSASIHGKFAAALVVKLVLSKVPNLNKLVATVGLDSQMRAAAKALKEPE
jgi:hypothetical protein